MQDHIISTRRSGPNSAAERGIALAGVLIFALVASAFSAAVLHSLSVHSQLIQDDYNHTRALYLAESGLNRAAEAMWIGYLNANPLPSVRVAWLDQHYTDFDQENVAYGGDGDTYTVRARRIMTTGNSDERLVVFEAKGRTVVGEIPVERALTRVVRYGHDQSSIFDYTYFLNNFGWFWGSTITANGEVRANANFDLQSSPKVNGDVYGSVNPDVGAAGTVTGSYLTDNLTTYRNNAANHWRPTNPPFEYGFAGDSERFAEQDILEMPYLSDISRFEALAQNKNGQLSTSTVTIGGLTVPGVTLNNVIQGPVFLVGTPTNPIIIDGPVVVKGDVAITGYVQGQGTIYAERNIHVLGDIRYTNQPIFDHSESAPPDANAEHNANADFLGLASRGNVIVGNYNDTDWSVVKNYIKPTFTKPYTDEDGTTHNGDYTAYDGGLKQDGTSRRRYESTWSNTNFTNMANLAKTLFGRSNHRSQRIDGLIYTNHLMAGRFQNFHLNGAMMCRDEGCVYNTSFNANYDYRAKAEGEYYIDIDLPKAANAEPTVWLDGPYEDWVSKLDPLDYGLQQ